MYSAPRGTIDILPEDEAYWDYLRRLFRKVAGLFDYHRIQVPIFEETSLYIRGVGEGTDIVDKEMYSFVDKGGRDITLRPEYTAGIMRAYIEHGMKILPQPVKLYAMGPIFRYESVQAGRYRQHTQFDIEAIGSLDPAVDVEVMSVAWQLFRRIGFEELVFQLNSTGCPRCRPAYVERLVEYYRDHLDAICEDCHRRLERNPLRLLDCKEDSCQPIIAEAPHIADHLCPECEEHFIAVREQLDLLQRPYTLNHRLVRGLDYYTKTVFEVWAKGIGAQNAICGGGRYDGLAQELGGEPTPGIGFGSGVERLVLAMKEQGIEVPSASVPHVVLVYIGERAKRRAISLLESLRTVGIRAVMSFDDRSVKAQFRAADRTNAPYALVLGEAELEQDQITLQSMYERTPQEQISLDRIVRVLQERLRSQDK